MSVKQQEDFTVEDVMQYIEEHDIRLGFIYLFVDNTINTYQTPITFERYERLCFLMLKKYMLEKNKLIKTLKGGDNCLTLTSLALQTHILTNFLTER